VQGWCRVTLVTVNVASVTTARSVPALSANQLAEVLPLMRSSDNVELKLSVPDADRRSTVAALGIDVLDAQIRQVAFFDTPELTLDRRGVVVRVRRVQGKPADTIVKLRPVIPGELPASVRKSPDFSVEVDAMPGGFVCSGAMKSELDAVKVKKALAGDRPLRKLLSREQKDLFAAHAPSGPSLDELQMLGPINVLKLKFTPEGFGRRLVAELWYYPNGSRILELSTKCAPDEAIEVAAETKAFLAGKGVDLGAAQQTKTRSALKFFATELQTASSG
jgi:hypothetical protein